MPLSCVLSGQTLLTLPVGNVAAQALEDLPNEARGLVSGMFQAGYPFGYMLATAFARALVNTTTHGWRPLFW